MRLMNPSKKFTRRIVYHDTVEGMRGVPICFINAGNDDQNNQQVISSLDIRPENLPDELLHAEQTARLIEILLNAYYMGNLFVHDDSPDQMTIFEEPDVEQDH